MQKKSQRWDVGTGKSNKGLPVVYNVPNTKSKQPTHTKDRHFIDSDAWVSSHDKAMLCDDSDTLTPWERGFIDDLLERFDDSDASGYEYELSDKQEAKLEQIYRKVRARA